MFRTAVASRQKTRKSTSLCLRCSFDAPNAIIRGLKRNWPLLGGLRKEPAIVDVFGDYSTDPKILSKSRAQVLNQFRVFSAQSRDLCVSAVEDFQNTYRRER